MVQLPQSVQEIADVIGRTAALELVGQLPTYEVRDKRYPNSITNRKVLFVPTSLKPDDRIISMIGYINATKLIRAFGGSFLFPAPCAEIYRVFINQTIQRLHSEGMKAAEIAESIDISLRRVYRTLEADKRK